MKLIDIENEYKNDSKIDRDALDNESLKTTNLYCKYLKYHNKECMTLRTFKKSYDARYKVMWEYYNGKLDIDELKEHNLEPFNLKILKADIHIYLNADESLAVLKDKITFQEQKINYLESILKELNSRNWAIKNAIQWKQFQNGII